MIHPVHSNIYLSRFEKFNYLENVGQGGIKPFVPWTRMCLLRLPLCENRNKHSLHSYGFSPLCIRKCLVRVLLSENAFLHNRQRYGLSPEWVLMCVVTEDDWEKRLSQTGHLNGFSPLCVRT